MNKIKVPTIGVKGKVGQSYEEKEKILLCTIYISRKLNYITGE